MIFSPCIWVSQTTADVIQYLTVACAVFMGGLLLYNWRMENGSANEEPRGREKEDIEKRKLLSRVGLGGAIAIIMNADGRPTKAELEEAKNFLRKHFTRENQIDILHHIKRVLALKRPNTDYYLKLINISFNYKKRILIVDMLYEVASFNGGITPDEWRLLDRMMALLHITEADQQLFHLRYHNRIGSCRFTDNNTINTSENSLNRCYSTLGLKKGASAEDVKRAYRNLVMKYHPDRLSGETDPQKIYEYTVKFREINEAYEELLEVVG